MCKIKNRYRPTARKSTKATWVCATKNTTAPSAAVYVVWLSPSCRDS